jgi:hypothetical protein
MTKQIQRKNEKSASGASLLSLSLLLRLRLQVFSKTRN